jgi:hypothetical protein
MSNEPLDDSPLSLALYGIGRLLDAEGIYAEAFHAIMDGDFEKAARLEEEARKINDGIRSKCRPDIETSENTDSTSKRV